MCIYIYIYTYRERERDVVAYCKLHVACCELHARACVCAGVCMCIVSRHLHTRVTLCVCIPVLR